MRAAWPAALLVVIYWGLTASPAEPVVETTGTGRPTVEATRALVDRARALMNAGQYAEALEPMRALRDADQTSHVYARDLAQIARHLGRPQDEARHLEDFLRLSPTPFEACPRIGEVYWEQGARKQSLDAYHRCFAFDEADPDGVFYLARAYEWAERYDDAQRLYQRGTELDPHYLDMHLGLARLQLRRGHVGDARARALQVLTRAPEDVDAMLILGLAFQREGNRPEARKYLERGLKIKDTYADFHLALGILDEEDARVSQALQHYTRTIALDQTNREAVVRRDRLAERMKLGGGR